MAEFLDKLNTAIFQLNASGTIVLHNKAFEKLTGLSDLQLKNNAAELSQTNPYLSKLETLIKKAMAGELDEELSSSSRHQRFEIKIEGSYYNVYLEKLEEGDYLFELTQIVYQDMNQSTHELKRPIQNIKALVETLEIGAKNDKEKLDEYLMKLNAEADRLGVMVSDMLSLSHLLNGMAEINKTPVDLQVRVNKLIELAASRAAQKSVSLENKVAAGIKLEADVKLLDHVISNLVDNAIKYNKEGGSVMLSFEDNAIHITDTGLGMSEEDAIRVFDQFYRIKDRAHIQGTGLGLSIVKAIIDLHAWNISIESELGKGTSFVIKVA